MNALFSYLSVFAFEQGNPVSNSLHSPHCGNGWHH